MSSDENPPDEGAESEKSHTTLLAVLALCSFFVGLDTSVTIPLVPAIAESTRAPVHLGQLLVSVYALAYMVTAPIFGAVSDAWGRKKTIFTGMLILAIGTFLTGTGTSFGVLLLFRALTGVGAGMLQPGVFALIGDVFPYERRGQAMGIATGALLSATLVGPPIGGYIAVLTTWHWAFWLVAVGAAAMLAVIYTLIPTDQPAEAGAPLSTVGSQFRTAFSTPTVLFALVAVFLFFGGSEGAFANFGVLFDLKYGLNPGQTGVVMLVGGIFAAIGAAGGGRVADRVGKKVVIGSGCVLGGVGIFFLMSAQTIGIAIGMALVWSVGLGAGQSTLTTLVSELDPNVRGTVLALRSSAMYAGSFTLTTASAALLEWGDFLLVGIACGGAVLVALPIVWYRVEEHAAGESDPEPSTPPADMD